MNAVRKELLESRNNARDLKLFYTNSMTRNDEDELATSKKREIDRVKIQDRALHKKRMGTKLIKISGTKTKPASKNKENNEVASSVQNSSDPMANTGADNFTSVKWDLEADPNKPMEEYTNPKSYNKDIAIVSILNVRKKAGEPTELFVKWSCNSKEWTTIQNAIADEGLTAIQQYNETHGLEFIRSYLADEGIQLEKNIELVEDNILPTNTSKNCGESNMK